MSRKKLSIKTNIAIILLLSFIVLGVLFAISYSYNSKIIIANSVNENILHVAGNSLQRVNERTQNISAAARSLAEEVDIKAALRGDSDAAQRYFDSSNVLSLGKINFIALLDTQGQAMFEEYFDYKDYKYIHKPAYIDRYYLLQSRRIAEESAGGYQDESSAFVSEGFAMEEDTMFYLCVNPVIEQGRIIGSVALGQYVDKTDLLTETGDEYTLFFMSGDSVELSEEEQQKINETGFSYRMEDNAGYLFSKMDSIYGASSTFMMLSDNDAYARINAFLISEIFILVVGILIIMFFFSYVLNKKLLNPARDVCEKLDRVNIYSGNESITIDSKASAEVQVIADSVNSVLERAKAEIDAVSESRELMYYMANYDNLTYLLNRFSAQSALTEQIEKAKQNDRTIQVFFFDLDHFKNINDSLGHDVGDKVIVELATRMRERLGDKVLIARMGGDEFLVAGQPEALGENETYEDIINEVLNVPIISVERELIIRASIGCSLFPENGEEAEVLIRKAEIAMYNAKEQDGYRFLMYRNEFQEHLNQRMEIESKMRKVVTNECSEFKVFLQPKATIENGEINRCEALIRWFAPEGMIPPDKFIPYAEESGLIIPMSWWLIRECCRLAKKMRDLKYPCVISINIPATVLLHEDFIPVIKTAVSESGIDYSFLDIEITESTLLVDMEEVNDILKDLRELGLETSVDDFGTGYSSLSYLSKLAVDRIKIDRSFVMAIEEDEDSRNIVKAIMALAKSLKMVVTAEGVETWSQFLFLKGIECQEAQGYYICRPLDDEKYLEFIMSWDKNKLLSGNL